MQKSAVFLDRDGTIIRDAEYLADPAGVALLPGAVEGLKQLQAAGYLLVVTTNQSGVARGYFNEQTVHAVNARLQAMLAENGVTLDGIYYCPHHSQGTVPEYTLACRCRKPQPGMLEDAQKDLQIDLSGSWVIGDKLADIQFGKSKQLGTILVLTGYGGTVVLTGFSEKDRPDFVASDLGDAAGKILSQKNISQESMP